MVETRAAGGGGRGGGGGGGEKGAPFLSLDICRSKISMFCVFCFAFRCDRQERTLSLKASSVSGASRSGAERKRQRERERKAEASGEISEVSISIEPFSLFVSFGGLNRENARARSLLPRLRPRRQHVGVGHASVLHIGDGERRSSPRDGAAGFKWGRSYCCCSRRRCRGRFGRPAAAVGAGRAPDGGPAVQGVHSGAHDRQDALRSVVCVSRLERRRKKERRGQKKKKKKPHRFEQVPPLFSQPFFLVPPPSLQAKKK